MKTKIILLIFIFALIALIQLRNTSTLTNAIFFDEVANKTCVYAYSDYGQEDVTKCGELKIINGTTEFANSLKFNDFLGQMLEFNKIDFDSFISSNNIEVLSTEKVEDITIYNCYVSSLPKFVVVKNKRVNMQIAITNECVKVGYPLILGGF